MQSLHDIVGLQLQLHCTEKQSQMQYTNYKLTYY